MNSDPLHGQVQLASLESCRRTLRPSIVVDRVLPGSYVVKRANGTSLAGLPHLELSADSAEPWALELQ